MYKLYLAFEDDLAFAVTAVLLSIFSVITVIVAMVTADILLLIIGMIILGGIALIAKHKSRKFN